jgi:predicted nucleic acid-binding protein
MAHTYNLNAKFYPRDKRLFTDTNIFILVFWRINLLNPRMSYYRADYEDLLEMGFKFYANFDVIAEVINTVMHYEWDNAKGFQPTLLKDFKVFRDTTQGQKLLDATYEKVEKKILNHVEILDRTFDINDIRNMIVNDGLDCTDKMINKICTAYNVPLLTDDKDFRYTKLDILTRNKMIINERSRAIITPIINKEPLMKNSN